MEVLKNHQGYHHLLVSLAQLLQRWNHLEAMHGTCWRGGLQPVDPIAERLQATGSPGIGAAAEIKRYFAL